MFMGEYNYTMDEKGRLNLPPRFREQLEQGMVLTRWMDQCLVLFPQQEWERICQKLQSRSMVKTRDLQRFLFALASEAAVDKQGRILVSPALRSHAGLQKDVTLIGVGTHAELWDTKTWHERQAEFGTQELEAAMEELEL
ncbi:division/cell wall cluster transcriptional repressor MraZ [uncultured Allofournierella sp.]|uniref:division/cell wall cluster transcriptional repressor MraZ n=1 Tax=uncultured Allofournierella sp. TaxID=1940258 RepID=UPI003751A343